MGRNSGWFNAALVASGFLATAMASTSAAAQDWDTALDLRAKSIVAYVQFDNGITLASRCVDGDFEVLLMGLPESGKDAFSRVLSVSVGDEPLGEETWSVGSSPVTAFSRLPAPFARRLAEGGAFQIRVPGEAGKPSTRYVMQLSSSPTAVEQTLTACGRPLADPRDTLLSRNAVEGLAQGAADQPKIEWASMPRPEYPMARAAGYASRGDVTLSCAVLESGMLESCVVESEHPPKYNFAREAIRAALRARLRLASGAEGSLAGRVVVYSTSFRLE